MQFLLQQLSKRPAAWSSQACCRKTAYRSLSTTCSLARLASSGTSSLSDGTKNRSCMNRASQQLEHEQFRRKQFSLFSTYVHPVSSSVSHDAGWQASYFDKPCPNKELPPPQEWAMFHGKIAVLQKCQEQQKQLQKHQPEQQQTLFHGKIPILQEAATVETDTEKPSLSVASTAAASTATESDSSTGSDSMSPPSGSSSGSSTGVYGHGGRVGPRTCLLMELTDRVGVLYSVLKHFDDHGVNICRIESRPATKDSTPPGQLPRFDFFVDLQGSPSDANVADLLKTLGSVTNKLLVLDEEKQVQWFPRHVSELDLIVHRTLDAGDDLESDHPGFQDAAYRQRRAELAQAAREYTWDRNSIPRLQYTDDERSVWTAVWDKMQDLWKAYACREYQSSLQLMKEHCGYHRDQIPQQQDISQFLFQTTQFQLRPVAGLLSSRDFLNGLAFRVFFCTQYIRHASRPLYTPEPDICHELLGHVPMFADPDFADFSQEIGLASLGASDEDILKLARCYWFSVEFGLCLEGGKRKAYGAGLLSSFGELEYACRDYDDVKKDAVEGTDQVLEQQQRPEFKKWDPYAAAAQEFPITTYQPLYFVAPSLQDVKVSMRHYCQDLPRPFYAQYNAQTETIHIDRPVKRTQGVPS